MIRRRVPVSKLALWQRRSQEVLTSDVVASRNPGPPAPPEWRKAWQQLIEASRSPHPPPPWWNPTAAYFGSVETRTDPATYYWDGMKRLRRLDRPLFFFQFTLAGSGHFQTHGAPGRDIPAGTGFFAVVPSRHRYFLPPDSRGWTFGWIGVYHRYLLERVSKQVAATGPIVTLAPDSALAASAVRLVRGAIKKDFRDRFEVELALFELVLAYERQAHQAGDLTGERERLLESVRGHALANLRKTLSVDELAAEFGMGRCRFSRFFRSRTGLTPAHYVAEVRIAEAARLLLETREPLKQIADACGFANPNHFCRVFRRFQHISPNAYRHAIG